MVRSASRGGVSSGGADACGADRTDLGMSKRLGQWSRGSGERPWLHRATGRLVCALGCAALLPTVAGAQVTAAAVVQRHGARFEMGELAAVESGEVVAKLLPTADSRDVAVLGLVRLDVSRDVYLRQLRDLRSWLRTPTREHLGLFSLPASLADVSALEVDPKSVSELRKCRPGNCSTKLSASQMLRLQDEVDWSRADVLTRVTTLARQRLVRLVDEYRAQGNAVLPVFADREPPVRAADAADAVQAQSTFLQQIAPQVANHLRSYPRDRLVGATDTLFWAESVVSRLRPILSLTHMVIYTPPEPSGWSLVASKQLYANHYFEGALELVDIVDRSLPGDAPGIYLAVEQRYRFDNLPRGGLLNIRSRAANGLRDQLIANLRRERRPP